MLNCNNFSSYCIVFNLIGIRSYCIIIGVNLISLHRWLLHVYLECIVSLVMHIASGSGFGMLIRMFILFCTWPVICFAIHVLVFVLCEHFCLVSMCSHVYCLYPTHLVILLLVQLPHLLSLITLLICSIFILLVFVVL